MLRSGITQRHQYLGRRAAEQRGAEAQGGQARSGGMAHRAAQLEGADAQGGQARSGGMAHRAAGLEGAEAQGGQARSRGMAHRAARLEGADACGAGAVHLTVPLCLTPALWLRAQCAVLWAPPLPRIFKLNALSFSPFLPCGFDPNVLCSVPPSCLVAWSSMRCALWPFLAL